VEPEKQEGRGEMSRYAQYIPLLIGIAGGVWITLFLRGYAYGFAVKQEIREDRMSIFCPSGNCFVTYVWHEGEILESWRDDVVSMPDTMPAFRRRQGEDLIKKLKQ
jgi:hypothetical protein